MATSDESSDATAPPPSRAPTRKIRGPVVTDRGTPNDHWDDHGASWWAPHPVAPSYRTSGGNGDANAPSASQAIEFQVEAGTYTGHSESGRSWRITRVLTGWHLEFHDQGDPAATNAGVHRSFEAAIAEANR